MSHEVQSLQNVGYINVRERTPFLQRLNKHVHRLAHPLIRKKASHVIECLVKYRLDLVTLQLAVITSVVTGSDEQLVTQLVVHLLVVEYHSSTQGIGNGEAHRDAVMPQDVLPCPSGRESWVSREEELRCELDAAWTFSIKSHCREQISSVKDRQSQCHACHAITLIQFIAIFHDPFFCHSLRLLFTAKVGGNLTPLARFPFQQGIAPCMGGQPTLGTLDNLKQPRIGIGMR